MRKKIMLIILSFIFVFGFVACGKPTTHEHLTNYTLDIKYDHLNKCLDVVEDVEYINNYDDPLEHICFHLYPNAFRENAKQKVVGISNYNLAYPNGVSYGKIDIETVSIGGTEINYQVGGFDENILDINFNQPLFPNEKCKIQMKFKVILPNINHRFGYGANTINIANFYPIACVFENGDFMTKPYSSNGDPFYSHMSNYAVSITYDDMLILANTGEVISQENKNGNITSVIEANCVRDFAMVLSEKFNKLEKVVGDTKIKYYYYNDLRPKESLHTSCLALETFEDLIGDYPYSTLSVVESNFVHGGMEFPNLVYISDSLPTYEDYTNVIVHEIAHQWWYNMVGSDAFNNGWQDEGITEYTTAMFYEKNPSYNINKNNIIYNNIKNYSFFVDVYTAVYKELDTSMTRALDEYATEPEYVYIAYVKSMLMFDSLRSVLGDKDFFKGLKLYFETCKFKEASPEEMIACFEKGSGKELENFFDAWLDGKIVIVAN